MGLFQILKEAFTSVPTFDDLNDEFYDGLEEAMILADIGADTADDIVRQLRKRVKERFIGRMDEVKDALRDILRSKLEMLTRIAAIAGVEGALELEVTINEQIRAVRPIKLEDRLRHMNEKNPLLAELRRELDLEVE